MYTSKRSFNETSIFLLNHGAEVNAQSTKRGVTALMIVAAAGNEKMVLELLDRGADASLRDRRGETAKVIAQRRGHTNIAEILEKRPFPMSNS